MSDANTQSVEVKRSKVKRCEYRHSWRKIEEQVFECSTCNYRPKQDSESCHEAEAIVHLREVLNPGDTVYTVLRHVSRSGMSRGIDVYYLKDSEPIWITGYVGHAIGSPQSTEDWRKSRGLRVGGCGMDMGFHLVNSLSYVIFPEYKCLGENKHCPSNYHTNHRNTVQCQGSGTGDDWTPCFRSDTVKLPDLEVEENGEKFAVSQGKAYTIRHDDGTETICPTCNGFGRYPNPDGPEKWNLIHKDGYALRHKWL